VGEGIQEVAVLTERIGFDFDGTLTRWPPLVRFLVSVLNSTTTPRFIYEPFWRTLIYIPIFPNLKRLKQIKEEHPNFEFYVITGRSNLPLVEQLLKDYGCRKYFEGIYHYERPNKLNVQQFKEKFCKGIGIDWYFDDNRYTIYYLREKGIRAIRV